MTQNNDSIVFRVTGRRADDTVLWASEAARKITYFNPAGRKLADIFNGYFCADNPDIGSGALVNVEGANFIANSINIGMDDCCAVILFAVPSYFGSAEDENISPDEEMGRKTVALRLAVRDLELNRKKLKNSNEIAGMGSFEYLSEQRCLVMTPEACKAIGMRQCTTVISLDDLCHRVKNGSMSGLCDSIQTSNLRTSLDTEMILIDDSGTERVVKVVLKKLSQEDNIVDGVFMDVTYIKNAEKELKKQDAYFRVLFEKANIGIFTVNTDGVILACNQFIRNLTGYTDEELSRESCVDLLVHPEDREKIRFVFNKIPQNTGGTSPSDIKIISSDGAEHDVLVSFEIILSDDGEPAIFGFVSNISDFKKMQSLNMEQERMLLQQSKMATMGEMMGIIAHQWMQPLNSIAMIAQMMQELADVDEENDTLIRKSVSSILDQINFMTATANDFRQFLKPSEKQSVFNPADAVDNVLSMYRPQLKYNDVKCGVFFDSDEAKNARVVGYENEFKNVIMNLCINARDAMEQNNIQDAEIEIYFEKVGDKICVSVCDNGGGIPDHIMKKIFCAYVSSKGEKGTGLGLYMSKLIIKERMKGDIAAFNSKDGAVIKITLDDVSNKQ